MDRSESKDILRGYRPLCFVGNDILLSKKNSLYLFDLSSGDNRFIAAVDTGIKEKLILSNRLSSRVLRAGFHCAVHLGGDQVLLSYGNRILDLDINKGSLTCDHTIRMGSRPLMLSTIKDLQGFDDMSCYGEYWYNVDKEAVNIWGRKKSDVWEIVFTFPVGTIEHIHAILPDPMRDAVWILTGDTGSASGFWMAKDNFATVIPAAIGQQDFRACMAFFTAEGIVYGTDSQYQENSIRILKQKNGTWVSEVLHPLAGPCIYACQLGDDFFFSTSVEPGKVTGNTLVDIFDRRRSPNIKENSCEIVYGNPSAGFATTTKWAKDFWPLRLGQFGTITFPAGFNPTDVIYAYGIAVKSFDDCTVKIRPRDLSKV